MSVPLKYGMSIAGSSAGRQLMNEGTSCSCENSSEISAKMRTEGVCGKDSKAI